VEATLAGVWHEPVDRLGMAADIGLCRRASLREKGSGRVSLSPQRRKPPAVSYAFEPGQLIDNLVMPLRNPTEEDFLSTLIFVHGACVRDANWWWSRMTEPLAGRGIASVAVPLPSCGEAGGALGDLYADVEAGRRSQRPSRPSCFAGTPTAEW
jgi:hypothetical protein